MDIRKAVIEKLKGDDALCSMLAEGEKSVYMTYSEDAGTYPVMVFHVVDNTPVLFGDDEEMYSRTRFQLTIITEDAEYDGIESRIKADMGELGFTRDITLEYRDGGLHFRVMQYLGNNKE